MSRRAMSREGGRFGASDTSSNSKLTLLLLALLPAGACAPETAFAQDTTLPRVIIVEPGPGRPAPKRARPARTRQGQTGAQQTQQQTPPQTGSGTVTTTPLNTNTVTEVGSHLGLTARQTPATVEVVNQQVLTERGYHTTVEAAAAFPGVTSADNPGGLGSFSMRGFNEAQISTLYNGIRVGPNSFVSRPMDTGNLDRIEILKGPGSLQSGEGATGGAVNFVTKAPHTGPIVNEAFASFDLLKGFRYGFGSGGSTAIKGLRLSVRCHAVQPSPVH